MTTELLTLRDETPHLAPRRTLLTDALWIALRREPPPAADELQQLGEHVLALTPRISPCPPDTLLLEVRGCLRLFGGAAALLQRLEQLLASMDPVPHQAIGPTPEAARHFTWFAPQHSLAQLTPEGALDRERFLALVHALPLDALLLEEKAPGKKVLEKKVRRRLRKTGFRHLGELLALPRPVIGQRFGKGLLHWLERLLGERADPRPPLPLPETFQAERDFDDPVCHVNGLLRPMEVLTGELLEWLRARQCRTHGLCWHFRDHQGETPPLVVRRAQPDLDMQRWMQLTARRLEWTQLRAPVLALRLECEPPRRLAHASASLLPQPGDRPPEHLLFEDLASLPGLRYETPGVPGGHLPESPPGETPAPACAWRPLWLLEQPLSLSRQPLPHWKGTALELLPGEERLQGEWWNTPLLRRYHIARHPRGWYAWVFRSGPEWWLHGIF